MVSHENDCLRFTHFLWKLKVIPFEGKDSFVLKRTFGIQCAYLMDIGIRAMNESYIGSSAYIWLKLLELG